MPDDKTEKTPRENQQKEENKYKSGAANKNTKADLDAITFKNAQAKKLLELQKRKKKKENDKKREPRKTSGTRGNLGFGGTVLGARRRKKATRKKKNNRLT